MPSGQRSGQLLARRILDATSLLVQNARQRNWTGAASAARHRQGLLARLEQQAPSFNVSCMRALREAVRESDTALAAMDPMQVAAPSAPVLR